jgi:hypothetical protein
MLSPPGPSGRRSSPPNSEVSFLPLRDHDDEADVHESRNSGDDTHDSEAHLVPPDLEELRDSSSSSADEASSVTVDDVDVNPSAGARVRVIFTSQRIAIAVAAVLAIVCGLLLAGVLRTPDNDNDNDDGIVTGPTSAPGPSVTTFIYLSEASLAESTFSNVTDTTHLRVSGKGPAWQKMLGEMHALVINLADGFDVTLVNGLPQESTIVHPHGLLPPVRRAFSVPSPELKHFVSLDHPSFAFSFARSAKTASHFSRRHPFSPTPRGSRDTQLSIAIRALTLLSASALQRTKMNNASHIC